MDFLADVTTVLAIYGAVLSTLLAIFEIVKEQRRIGIILELHQFSGGYIVTIVNIGHRPITIVAMTVAIGPDGMTIRQGSLLTENGQPPFPVTLTDGQHTRIGLSEVVSQEITEQKEQVFISVFDAEGREYKKYRKFAYNEKFGYYLPR